MSISSATFRGVKGAFGVHDSGCFEMFVAAFVSARVMAHGWFFRGGLHNRSLNANIPISVYNAFLEGLSPVEWAVAPVSLK